MHLKKNNRAVRRLIFATSQHVPKSDILAEQLLEEFDVFIRIFDREYFVQHVNDSPQLIGHFDQHL